MQCEISPAVMFVTITTFGQLVFLTIMLKITSFHWDQICESIQQSVQPVETYWGPSCKAHIVFLTFLLIYFFFLFIFL